MFVDWLTDWMNPMIYWNVLTAPLCNERVDTALKVAHVKDEATHTFEGSGPFKFLSCIIFHLNVNLILGSFMNFPEIISWIMMPSDKKACKEKINKACQLQQLCNSLGNWGTACFPHSATLGPGLSNAQRLAVSRNQDKEGKNLSLGYR